MTARAAWHLGVALTTVALMAVTSDALACDTRGAVDLERHHWRCAGSLLGRYGQSGETTALVPVCADAVENPGGECRTWVGVTVTLDGVPAVPDFSVRARVEQNRAQALGREAIAAAEHRRLVARPVMFYGIEPEPQGQFQLKREMLFLLARVSGQGLIGRAAAGLGPTSSLREFAQAEALESERVRATYLQIEELRGPNPLVTPLAVQGAYAALGAILFGTGLAGEKMLQGALGTAFEIHPQIWPPGIQVQGRFNSP